MCVFGSRLNSKNVFVGFLGGAEILEFFRLCFGLEVTV